MHCIRRLIPTKTGFSERTMRKILISACLLGVQCRHNGCDSKSESVMGTFEADELIPICPEQFGGLPPPRPPAEIVGGDGADVLDGNARVMTVERENKTEAFLHGAQQALEIAERHNATYAVLKSKSPSCGCGQVYDGSFVGNVTAGDGVTAALFRRHGIEIMTEAEIEVQEPS